MYYNREYNTISSSLNQMVTGSIVKVLALGADDAECTLSRIEFGKMTSPESSFTASSEISTDIQVPAGSYIDGPIGKLKVKTGGFLIYVEK